MDIEDELKNGTLLCRAVSVICKCRINGIFQNPKTDSTAISNIRKSLEILRKTPNMPQKYLWNEREIHKGNRTYLLGLLEDMHRMSDGECIQKRGSISSLGPYTGSSFEKLASCDKSIGLMHMDDNTRNQQEELLSVQKEEQEKLPVPNLYPISFGLDSAHSETRLKPFVFQKEADIEPRRRPSFYKPIDTSEAPLEDLTQMQSNNVLLKWFDKIQLNYPSTLNFNKPGLEEFRDGKLLCDLIGKLESKDLEGVVKQPKSTASALFNIRKALDFLQKKKTVPLTYLYSEEEILLGDNSTIMGLLYDIKGAYKLKEISIDRQMSTAVSKSMRQTMADDKRKQFSHIEEDD
jgi:hypothetical protein